MGRKANVGTTTNGSPPADGSGNGVGDVVADGSPALLDASAEASAIIGAAPEVSEHVVSNNQADNVSAVPGGGSSNGVQPGAGPSSAGSSPGPDALGWDPRIHVEKDGHGVRNADGSWRVKRKPRSTAPRTGGAGLGSGIAAGSGGGVSGAVGAVGVFNPEKSRVAGLMAGRAMLTVFSMFGSEWQADKDEREAVPSAFADYFVATQKQDFPPGVALTMVMCAYVGRRFTMPKTQSRMQALKLRFAAWMIRRKLRKQGIVARVVIQDGEIQIIRDDKPADA